MTELSESTRTAIEAARAVGGDVGQIVKSLVFVAGDEPILLLVSGAHQVDPDVVGRALGRPIRPARAAEVREATGFAIGGVAPIGLSRPLTTYADPALLAFDRVWAAAGSPRSVFPIAPAELVRATGAHLLTVAGAPATDA
ncbi:MAG TPA: YbaK/EbsC family protein [Dehalococcoidia bacterium]|nr:YbaK/EbsC family protein [Dehalococcoidia bacterium]